MNQGHGLDLFLVLLIIPRTVRKNMDTTKLDKECKKAIREKKHLWIATAVFKVNLGVNTTYHLNNGNLLQIVGVGCYVCEELYEDSEETCPGEPTGLPSGMIR